MSSPSLVLLAGLLTSLALVASWQAGCGLGDEANCVHWVRNGMCVNYPIAVIRAKCPNACANSGCNEADTTNATRTTPAAPKKENANCKTWNESPAVAYCATQSAERKKTVCFTTCVEELKTPATDDCAIYVDTAGKVVRTVVAKKANLEVTKTNAVDPNKLVSVFAKKGCKVTTAKVETGVADAKDFVKEYPVATEDTFTKVEANDAHATGVACTCA